MNGKINENISTFYVTTLYAKINNIDLLRIPYYNITKIPEILKEKLKL